MLKKYKDTFLQLLRQFLRGFSIFLALVCFPLSYFLKKQGWRVLATGYIVGHCSAEPDAYVKDKALGNVPDYKTILFPPFQSLISRHPWRLAVGNSYLLELWRQHFWVITNPVLAFFLYPILAAPCPRQPYLFHITKYFTDEVGKTFYDVNREYYKRYPVTQGTLRLPKKDIDEGWGKLEKWGIKKDDWFVCFHARDMAYGGPTEYERQRVFRNVDIETYAMALQEISSRGGWCIRMGASSSPALSDRLKAIPRMIDYPHTSLVSPFMDIFLLSSCRFYLGSSSGLSLVPGTFGIPSVLTNLAPANVLPLFPRDLCTLKLHYSEEKQRLLSFKEVFALSLQDALSEDLAKVRVRLIDNSEEEILEAVKEMFAQLSNREISDGLYEKLHQKFMENLPPIRCKSSIAKLGRHFLKKYAFLVD